MYEETAVIREDTMPNWIEGTMKLRGKREDIKRFFDEGLEASSYAGEASDIKEQVVDDSGNDYLDYAFKDEPHIAGTRRAFITDDNVYMEDKEGIACVDVKQAWAFDAGRDSKDLDNWKAISDKYNIDIRLFGIEMGMQFTQEIIILRGRSPIENVRRYEDWDWECPFPNMGG